MFMIIYYLIKSKKRKKVNTMTNFGNLKSKKVLTEGYFKAKALDYTSGTYDNGKTYGILSLDIEEVGKHNFLLGEQEFTDKTTGDIRKVMPYDRMSSYNNYLATQLKLGNGANAFEYALEKDITFDIKIIENENNGRLYHNLQIPAKKQTISEEDVTAAFATVEYVE